ncbi:DUF4091 domain-containing protein [uncultured Paludibaculum sp.]|uniref:DUF4091 domain-containing protein n=1 Tax=uncultured Paludibaculum sp. TaxID=1765020 RepID=UPI002AABCD62|nr:DUF4091 domain-containing protein [uncultured Paludibaculum sp.]
MLLFGIVCAAQELLLLPEHMRPDPFGKVVEVDRTAGLVPGKSITLEAARASFVSCHVLVSMPKQGAYRLEVTPFPSSSQLQAELFREWYHFLPKSKGYYPDALEPISLTVQSKLPAPDNRIADQTAQGYWLDIWIPANAVPGVYETKAVLAMNGRKSTAVLKVRVLDATVPAEDAVTMDHNTYGTSWLAGDYPTLSRQGSDDFYLSDRFFGLIHAYHRIFYDHRGTFHQLGYGHGGKVGPEFAPELAGTGRNKRIANWALFDRHYGPLLDGSAFANTHLGSRPTKLVYLPINPEWPASYLWWGEPGYEQEFVNVVSAMEQHFREKGWTNTRFEMFFNHKKRYKAFPWDGDEARFLNDFPYLREYDRLLKLAVKRDSPVKFVFRADVSWMLEREIQEFAGVINMWICSHSDMSYLPDAPRLMKDRGDIVWTYGGTPEVTKPASHVTREVLWPWIWGTDGFVHWLATAPGPDPWFRFEGGGETLIYPGDRFGINGPIPSIRLKIQRNAVQDVTLLNEFRKTKPIDQLRAEAARRFNGTELKDWRSPRPAYADKDPLERTNADPGPERSPKFDAGLDAAAWQRVREYVVELVKGEQR